MRKVFFSQGSRPAPVSGGMVNDDSESEMETDIEVPVGELRPGKHRRAQSEDVGQSDTSLPPKRPKKLGIAVSRPRQTSKDVRDATGQRPLQKFCSRGDYARVRQILEDQPDLQDRDYGGTTALHSAALNGHADVVRALLDAGAVVDVRSGPEELDTPLIDATANANLPIVKLLLDGGADPRVRNAMGRIALDFVDEEAPDPEIVRALETRTKQLRRQGKPLVDSPNHPQAPRNLFPPGFVSVQRPPAPVFLDVGKKSVRNDIVEHAGMGHLEVVGAALERGWRPNAESLVLAAKFGHPEVVGLLLAFGLNANAEFEHTTALREAVKRGHVATAELLVESGARRNSLEPYVADLPENDPMRCFVEGRKPETTGTAGSSEKPAALASNPTPPSIERKPSSEKSVAKQPSQPESSKSESSKSESSRAVSSKAESSKHGSRKPEAGKSEAGKSETSKLERTPGSSHPQSRRSSEPQEDPLKPKVKVSEPKDEVSKPNEHCKESVSRMDLRSIKPKRRNQPDREKTPDPVSNTPKQGTPVEAKVEEEGEKSALFKEAPEVNRAGDGEEIHANGNHSSSNDEDASKDASDFKKEPIVKDASKDASSAKDTPEYQTSSKDVSPALTDVRPWAERSQQLNVLAELKDKQRKDREAKMLESLTRRRTPDRDSPEPEYSPKTQSPIESPKSPEPEPQPEPQPEPVTVTHLPYALRRMASTGRPQPVQPLLVHEMAGVPYFVDVQVCLALGEPKLHKKHPTLTKAVVTDAQKKLLWPFCRPWLCRPGESGTRVADSRRSFADMHLCWLPVSEALPLFTTSPAVVHIQLMPPAAPAQAPVSLPLKLQRRIMAGW